MVSSGILLVPLAGIFCLGVVCGFEWDVLPDDYVYACAGSKVTFPWNFQVTNDEQLVSVNWMYDGSMSSTMVATLVRDHFIPTTDYAARVQPVNNGGLVLEDLFVEDSGNYTVEVNVAGKEGLFGTFQKSVHLQVADGLMLEGELRVEQDPGAWWDQTSRQWFLRLTCGSFTFLGPPSVHIEWTTPNGQTKPSSGYESGFFYLSLPAPVRGGNYTCTIPPARLPDLCHKSHGDFDHALSFSAAVAVDEMKVRLSLLEANQKTLHEDRADLLTNQTALLEESAQLQAKLQSAEQTHVQDVQNLTEYCRGVENDMEDQMDIVQSVQQSLMEKVEIVNKTRQEAKKVSLTGPCRSSFYIKLDDAWRSTSEGSSNLQCDKGLEHGWYRFFLNGENAVIPTTCVPDNHCSTHASQWLDLRDQPLPEVGEETEGRACAHWSSNCCNWESPLTVRNCGPFYVYKLQPRDNCHLAYCVVLQK